MVVPDVEQETANHGGDKTETSGYVVTEVQDEQFRVDDAEDPVTRDLGVEGDRLDEPATDNPAVDCELVERNEIVAVKEEEEPGPAVEAAVDGSSGDNSPRPPDVGHAGNPSSAGSVTSNDVWISGKIAGNDLYAIIQ